MSDGLAVAKKFDFNTAKGVVMITVVVVIVILLIVFGKQIGTFISGLGNSINNLLGFSKPAAIQKADDIGTNADFTSGIDPNGPWSPNLYNANPDESTLDYSTLLDMCNKITGAVDPFLPNSIDPPVGAEIFAQFKLCQNKIDVSNLVVVFQQVKGGDLYTYVTHNLYNNNQSNQTIGAEIITYVDSLPAQ